MRAAPFQPSRDGFAFPNDFHVPGGVFGTNGPVAPTFGLAAGMCWAALDRWLEGRPVPALAEPPDVRNPLYIELVRRQANALAAAGGWAGLSRWQRLPDRGSRLSPGLTERTRSESRRVRRALDAGRPVLLLVIVAGDPFTSASENRLVLAYRYQLDRRSRRLALWVYDPNRPGSEGVRITLRTGPRRAPLEATLGARERVRGFVAVPYDRPAPPLLTLRTGPPPEEPPAGRPAAVAAGRNRLRLYARDRTSSLLELRRTWRGRWKPKNVTTGRGVGAAFRIGSDPAVLPGPRGRLTIYARTEDDVVRYERGPLRWRARSLAGALREAGRPSLRGRPAAALGPDRGEHVFVRGGDGELLHLRRPRGRKAVWTAGSLTARLEGADRVRLAGDPVAISAAGDRTVHVLARAEGGGIAHLSSTRDGGWRSALLPVELDPPEGDDGAAALSVVRAPGGSLHVFARGAGGGLIHCWFAGREWRREDVTASRGTIGDAFNIDDSPVAAAGPGDRLHVLARRGQELMLYGWSPETDWSAEKLTHGRFGEAGPTGDREPWVVLRRSGTVEALTGGGGESLRIAPAPRLSTPWLMIVLRGVLGELFAGPARAAAAVARLLAGIASSAGEVANDAREVAAELRGRANTAAAARTEARERKALSRAESKADAAREKEARRRARDEERARVEEEARLRAEEERAREAARAEQERALESTRLSEQAAEERLRLASEAEARPEQWATGSESGSTPPEPVDLADLGAVEQPDEAQERTELDGAEGLLELNIDEWPELEYGADASRIRMPEPGLEPEPEPEQEPVEEESIDEDWLRIQLEPVSPASDETARLREAEAKARGEAEEEARVEAEAKALLEAEKATAEAEKARADAEAKTKRAAEKATERARAAEDERANTAGAAAESPKPRVNPALDGLPLLEEPETPRGAPAGGAPEADPPPKPRLPEPEQRKRELQEMQRLMSLAEEYSPVLYDSEGRNPRKGDWRDD